MVAIMCRGRLQKAIVDGGLPWTAASRRPRSSGPKRLGSWAASLADESNVVAINERTYLTLVVCLHPVESFRERFVDSLRAALLDLGVPGDAVEAECVALRQAPFVRLRNPELAESLGFAEIEAGAHVGEGQDALSVQDMLNTYPYAGCGASCPAEAVSLLFGVSNVSNAGERRPADTGDPACAASSGRTP